MTHYWPPLRDRIGLCLHADDYLTTQEREFLLSCELQRSFDAQDVDEIDRIYHVIAGGGRDD